MASEEELDHVLQSLGNVDVPTLIAIRLEPRSLPAEIATTVYPQTHAIAEAAISRATNRSVILEAFD